MVELIGRAACSRIGRRAFVVATGSGLAFPATFGRAQATNGVALVIGNSKYRWEAALPNVRRDAPDVAKRLQALGVRTELVLDADQKTILAALEKLKAGAQGASFAAIYFAGHGVTWANAEYVVPVDADLSSPDSINSLVRKRQFYDAVAAAGHKLLVFDNCRNNPADGWRQLEAERRAGSSGTFKDPNYLMLSSTAPGHVALDGPAGQNSPFAAAFLRQLEAPAVEIQSLPEKLRRDVLIATEGRQILFSQSTYSAPFTINPSRAGTLPGTPPQTIDASRLVELPKAYAFAQENKFPLPAGLVAIRPSTNGPHSFKVGSFKATTRNKYGRYPCVVVVLSFEKGDKADVIWAGTGYLGAPGWQYYAGSLDGGRVKLFSKTGGSDSDEIYLEWKNANSGSFNMHQPMAMTGGMFSSDLVRLDG
jgi:hypothetical protein